MFLNWAAKQGWNLFLWTCNMNLLVDLDVSAQKFCGSLQQKCRVVLGYCEGPKVRFECHVYYCSCFSMWLIYLVQILNSFQFILWNTTWILWLYTWFFFFWNPCGKNFSACWRMLTNNVDVVKLEKSGGCKFVWLDSRPLRLSPHSNFSNFQVYQIVDGPRPRPQDIYVSSARPQASDEIDACEYWPACIDPSSSCSSICQRSRSNHLYHGNRY